MKKYAIVGIATVFSLVACQSEKTPIDREALLERNNPHVTAFDTLSSLSVGNGGFAVTVDASGLQTFPKEYSLGVPLGTQSDWGWHSFANPKNLLHSESLKDYDQALLQANPSHRHLKIRKVLCAFLHRNRLWENCQVFRLTPGVHQLQHTHP